MEQETRDILRCIGKLWLWLILPLSISGTIFGNGFQLASILITFKDLILSTLFFSIPYFIILILIKENPEYDSKTRWWAISILSLIFLGVSLNISYFGLIPHSILIPIPLLNLAIPLVYFGLWLIPLKFPRTKPLLVSSSIGSIISSFIVVLFSLVAPFLIRDSFGAGIVGAVFLVPLLGSIILISIIVGIILTIRRPALEKQSLPRKT